MPALNFKTEFVPAIEQGFKRQTIRPIRKNPIKAGDKLYLFTGLRTKKCRALFIPSLMDDNMLYAYADFKVTPYVICKSVESIRIEQMGTDTLEILSINGKAKFVNKTYDDLAIADGFKNWNELINFFKTNYGLPFEGVVVSW